MAASVLVLWAFPAGGPARAVSIEGAPTLRSTPSCRFAWSRSAGARPRTVGTVTEIYDCLRVLFARVGVPHCPRCGSVIAAQTIQHRWNPCVRLSAAVAQHGVDDAVRELGLDADLRSFLDAADHEWMLRMVAQRVADRRMLQLIGRWLRAGVMEGLKWRETL